MESSTIIVLGGPAAGKTVYLSVLYHHLWGGHDGLSMRAGSGTLHSELLKSAEDIQAGNFPPATQALKHYDFELRHNSMLLHLRFLDYPGELFRKVFYDMAVDSNEARQLYEACTAANGVIVLADPQSTVDGTWDIDYAITNLLRFYKSNGRRRPQFVLAFTKRDQTQALVKGSVTEFVRKRLPHLWQVLGSGMRLMHFCSVHRSADAIELARVEAVAAPLTAIIQAIEYDNAAKDRATYRRRVEWRRAVMRCTIGLVLAAATFLSFVAGVSCRYRVTRTRSTDAVRTDRR